MNPKCSSLPLSVTQTLTSLLSTPVERLLPGLHVDFLQTQASLRTPAITGRSHPSRRPAAPAALLPFLGVWTLTLTLPWASGLDLNFQEGEALRHLGVGLGETAVPLGPGLGPQQRRGQDASFLTWPPLLSTS